MNAFQLVRPKGILCLSGLLLASTLPLKTAYGSESLPTGSLEVHMRESSCSTEVYLSPILADVRSVLGPHGAVLTTDAVLAALEHAFGDRVTQTAAPMEYIWVKVDGIWEIRCIGGATFEIDFGSRGTVVVSARDFEPVL